MLQRYVFLSITFFFASIIGLGQKMEYNQVSSTTFEVTFTLDYELQAHSSYNFAQLFAVTTLEKGAPALPFFSSNIQLDPSMDVDFDLINSNSATFSPVEVSPSTGSFKASKKNEIFATEGIQYTNNSYFPLAVYGNSEVFCARSAKGITLYFYPFQYNGTEKKLQFHRQITIRGTLKPSEQQLVVIGKTTSTPLYPDFFIKQKQDTPLKFDALEEKGEMLIIHPASYAEVLKPFVQWKTQKGIKTHRASLDTIGTTATQIKNFVQQFYIDHPNLVYLILAADHDSIPAFYYGSSQGEEIYSDSYYGQLTGNDLLPELLVGRFSGNAAHIATMVQRTIEYEKDPLMSSWASNAIGLASAEGGAFGDLNEADYVHMRNIRDSLLLIGYENIYEFYDGSQGQLDAPGNPTPTDVLQAINAGVGLVNYTGHGDFTIWNTSNFTSNHVYQLTNHRKYPLILSVACNNGNFIYGNCLAEEFLRAKKNDSLTGAIAFYGSSILMAWAQPMRTQDNFIHLISNPNELTKKTTLGGLFYNAQAGMLQTYNDLDAQEVMKTWILFGDPSLVFRTKTPQTFTVQHPSTIDISATELAIECSEVGTEITLTHQQTILTSYVNNQFSSVAQFNLPQNTDSILVTVCKQDFIPYQRYVKIVDTTLSLNNNQLENIRIYPNPSDSYVNIALPKTANYSIRLIDATGKNVKESREINTKLIHYPIESLDVGIYQLIITNDQHQVYRQKIIKQ